MVEKIRQVGISLTERDLFLLGQLAKQRGIHIDAIIEKAIESYLQTQLFKI